MVFNSGLVLVGHTNVDGLCNALCNGKTFLLVSVYNFSFFPVFWFIGCFFVSLGFLFCFCLYGVFCLFFSFFYEVLHSSTSFVILLFAKNIQFDRWTQ